MKRPSPRLASGEAGLSLLLVIQGLILFVLAPLSATAVLGADWVEGSRFALAAIAIFVVTSDPLARWVIAGTFVVSLLATTALAHAFAGPAAHLWSISVTTAFEAAVTWSVARVVFRPGRVTFYRIQGAVVLYLSVGLIFGNLYRLAAISLHPSFAGLMAASQPEFGALLYFSFTTLTTTGFGDITPLHPLVRSMANLEAVLGQLFPATLLARLVTLEVNDRMRP
ncbi:MAG: ion channel [Phenylobacterium sp.]